MIIGCPYKFRQFNTQREACKVTHDVVEGFVMCECDWESCDDYQKQKKAADNLFEAIKRNAPKRMKGEPDESYYDACDTYWNSIYDLFGNDLKK